MGVELIEWNGWRDCIKVSGGGTEVVCTTAVGPRILSLTHDGGKNHLTVFKDSLGKTGGGKWTPYGGIRLWHAPEVMPRTYSPDNKKVRYELIENGCKLTQETEAGTGITKAMSVYISDDGALTIKSSLTNSGLWDVKLSVWLLAQLAPGGLLFSPVPSSDTGLVSNGMIALWPYAKMNDKRVYWGDKFITVAAESDAVTPFKYGASVEDGYAGYFNHGQLLISEFSYTAGGEYPNYSCNFESYTNSEFIELESLSPLYCLKPGQTASAETVFRIYDGVSKPARDGEAEIEAVLNKHLKIKR